MGVVNNLQAACWRVASFGVGVLAAVSATALGVAGVASVAAMMALVVVAWAIFLVLGVTNVALQLVNDLWVAITDVTAMTAALPIFLVALAVYSTRITWKTRKRRDKVHLREVAKQNRPTFRGVMRRVNKPFAVLAMVPLVPLFLLNGWTRVKNEGQALWNRYEEVSARDPKSVTKKTAKKAPAKKAAKKAAPKPEPTPEPEHAPVVTAQIPEAERIDGQTAEAGVVMAETMPGENTGNGEDKPIIASRWDNRKKQWRVTCIAPEDTYRWWQKEKPGPDYDPTSRLVVARLEKGRHGSTGEILSTEAMERYTAAVDLAVNQGVAEVINWEEAGTKKERSYKHGRAYARAKYTETGHEFLDKTREAWSLLNKMLVKDPTFNAREARKGFEDEVELISASLAVAS